MEIKKNQEEFDHDAAVDENPDVPMLSKFRFVVSKGKKRAWTQVESKQLTGQAALRNVEHLRQAKDFMECLGETNTDPHAAGSDGAVVRAIEKETAATAAEYRSIGQEHVCIRITTAEWLHMQDALVFQFQKRPYKCHLTNLISATKALQKRNQNQQPSQTSSQ